MNIKQKVEEMITQALDSLEVQNVSEIKVTHPDFLVHGDFTFNTLALAKKEQVNPREFAEQILAAITPSEDIEKIEIAGAGFLNFHLSKKFFANFLSGNEPKKLELLAGKFFLAEHTDPNLFKEVHIGHVMTNTIGESMGRIAEYAGADVKHVTFQGDVGLHIAKSIFGFQNIDENFDEESASFKEKQSFLGRCYMYGEKKYGEDQIFKDQINQINKDVYSQENEKINKIYEKGKQWSLDYLDHVYKMLGSNFDHYFLESTTYEEGQRMVKENIGGVFQESQGAIIFAGSEHGLHDRVFINSEGLPTYEAKDIGLFIKKWQKYNPDISMTVTSYEQDQYFKVVKKAAGLINKEWEEKTVHLSHGELKLPSGKMSSRKGKIVRALDWIEDWTEKILEKMEDRDIEDRQQIATKIAIAAIKYSILKNSTGRDIVYDENKALDFSGNSGPYLQYSYVRSQSILKKADTKFQDYSLKKGDVSDLEKLLYRFSEKIERSLETYSAHHVANFLYDLASEFNSFYANTKFLDTENPDYQYNLNVLSKFSEVMKQGLHILGIEVVEKM